MPFFLDRTHHVNFQKRQLRLYSSCFMTLPEHSNFTTCFILIWLASYLLVNPNTRLKLYST